MVCVSACMWLRERERERESAGVPWKAVLHKNFSLLLCWVGRQLDVTYIPSQFSLASLRPNVCTATLLETRSIERATFLSSRLMAEKTRWIWGILLSALYVVLVREIMDIIAYLARYNFAYMSGSPVQDIVPAFLLADSINWVKV